MNCPTVYLKGIHRNFDKAWSLNEKQSIAFYYTDTRNDSETLNKFQHVVWFNI
jgi:hypothetical protein